MNTTILFLVLSLCMISCRQGSLTSESTVPANGQLPDTTDITNNFYDNTLTNALQQYDLIIEGEVANPGKVNFSTLPVHSVIVKETLLDSTGGDRFVGAYRYDGYSLFDILNKSILKKSNADEFNPIIDLYVEVENSNGEKVVFSWGEIYYPNNLHKIIIATSVSRIVPSKTKDLWPLPSESKIVAASDLITERNISSPVKITVQSVKKSFPVVKGLSPMYSSGFKVFDAGKEVASLAPAEPENITYNTIFYGRGKGIHSTSPFKGMILRDVIASYYAVSRENLKTGIFCIAGKDGYRCAVSYSELFNRNDQQEFLLVRTEPEEDGGLFRVFPASDFFSDRAIKSLSEIHLIR
ncbi:MAG: hypothetical protein IPJ16_03000 [Bacteroidales bacterium]|nr:hypothetical protein [Bacteroidales bacterium]